MILAALVISFGLYHGASYRYAENPAMMQWDKDGPYIFYKNDSVLTLNYIRGNQKDGFYLDLKDYPSGTEIPAYSYFALDSSSFEFSIREEITIPKTTYNDGHKILAISDIESGFKTFRDFLIAQNVVDKNLHWTFGKGHLVLLGDFMDRDFSTTQVLWFIYKLEKEAIEQGGTVHFILGNHEIKNMQSNFESTSPKYFHIAAILGKKPSQLYDKNSLLGKWMASKNTIEKINGILFAHGGLHPDLRQHTTHLDQINQLVRERYDQPFYPNAEKSLKQLLISSHKGIAWYRGYFKDNLKEEVIQNGLAQFHASAIVVGHTLQSKIKAHFGGKVIAIDVKHPKDYSKSIPNRKSEGLLIDEGIFYRVVHNGEKQKL